MTNRLAHEVSPYLLQHAANPVDWFPWGPEALSQAVKQDRPIFLSIGYASCHWCHVMAHESFEDSDTAAFMNEHFVNVKVDREERPDLDTIYMEAVVALTGQGGWPMSVFLTPEGKPFFGGTYFPPAPRHGLPSFRQVLRAIADAWANDRQRLLATGTALVEEIARTPALTPRETALEPDVLRRASEALFRDYDWKSGGWGGAPKFPHAMSIEFLLHQCHRGGDRLALEMATHALRAMARGGIFDQVGGGFHRYATDAGWLVPHFEKMLYDNALLASTYLHAWLVSGDDDFRRTAEMTLDFILRDLRQAEGGLGSALDADSEGQEGKYYLWALEEVREALDDEGLAEFARLAFGLSEPGGFEGRNVLARSLADDDLAARLGIPGSEVELRLRQARDGLLAARAVRPAPGVDDQVLTGWNGLALIALAQAARALRRPDYLAAAQALASFLLAQMRLEGRWRRSWRQGNARSPAYLEDLAALGEGLLALYQADLNPHWYQTALGLGEEILDRFSDPRGGFFDTAVDESELIARPKSLQDNAAPSGNALAAQLLLRLACFTGEDRFAVPAEASLRALQDSLARYPTAFGAWLCAFDSALGPVGQLAVIGLPGEEAFQVLMQVVSRRYLPRLVVAGGSGREAGAPAFLKGRGGTDGRPTAYLCRGFACQLPVQEPSALEWQLDEMFGSSSAQRAGSGAQR